VTHSLWKPSPGRSSCAIEARAYPLRSSRSAVRGFVRYGDRGKSAQSPGRVSGTVYRSQGKLSVYYEPYTCGLHDIARCLYGALATPAAQRQREAAITSMTQRLHVISRCSGSRTRLEI